MNENDFQTFLAWIYWLTVPASVGGMIVCAMWFLKMRQRTSRIVFGLGTVWMGAMSGLRFTIAYDLENYFLRAFVSGMFLVGSYISVFIFYWTYRIQGRERQQNPQPELAAIIHSLDAAQIDRIINSLHPRDAEKLVHRNRVLLR